ncbi:MAG: ATP-binding cassette domain-containing protein [Lachnospiraceae bacterium]|nr:ATP-binding cassette domain-containing protein [Lachnospiraceae bacterium]
MKIELKNVTKVINRNVVLDDISYSFEGGSVYGLSGKNGCGKSMLMRCIAGLIYAEKGIVKINEDILGKDISFPRSIGVLIENPVFLNEYTGFENLKLIADIDGNIQDEEISDCIKKVGLNPDDKKKFFKYSLGMKQRLGIAAAIMGMPEVILLDEPINAIDEEGVSEIRRIVRNLVDKNRIIIVACHDRAEMELLADRIIEMSEGKIIGERINEIAEIPEI